MRIFGPILVAVIAGMLIGGGAIVHGHDVGPVRQQQQQAPMDATQEIQLLKAQNEELQLLVEWQRNKINRLEQENWQMYKALREKE